MNQRVPCESYTSHRVRGGTPMQHRRYIGGPWIRHWVYCPLESIVAGVAREVRGCHASPLPPASVVVIIAVGEKTDPRNPLDGLYHAHERELGVILADQVTPSANWTGAHIAMGISRARWVQDGGLRAEFSVQMVFTGVQFDRWNFFCKHGDRLNLHRRLVAARNGESIRRATPQVHLPSDHHGSPTLAPRFF